MSEVKLWRYYFPNIKGEGWAEIVIGSNGFFAAVSDYGNYSFAWRSMGCKDAREFYLRAPAEWNYFANKLGTYEQFREYDGDATERNIKQTIIDDRRAGYLTREKAREEWEKVSVYGHVDRQADFVRWYDAQGLGPDAHELARHRCNPSLEYFCKETMARLADAIRDELAAERRSA